MSRKKIVFMFIYLGLGTTLGVRYILPLIFNTFIPASKGDAIAVIFEKHGPSCGQTAYKDCSANDKSQPCNLDQWEKNILIGNYITEVVSNWDGNVLNVYREFEWFFMPYFYDYERHQGSCVRISTHNGRSTLLFRLKQFLNGK